jgi:hypothetical protein
LRITAFRLEVEKRVTIAFAACSMKNCAAVLRGNRT